MEKREAVEYVVDKLWIALNARMEVISNINKTRKEAEYVYTATLLLAKIRIDMGDAFPPPVVGFHGSTFAMEWKPLPSFCLGIAIGPHDVDVETRDDLVREEIVKCFQQYETVEYLEYLKPLLERILREFELAMGIRYE